MGGNWYARTNDSAISENKYNNVSQQNFRVLTENFKENIDKKVRKLAL